MVDDISTFLFDANVKYLFTKMIRSQMFCSLLNAANMFSVKRFIVCSPRHQVYITWKDLNYFFIKVGFTFRTSTHLCADLLYCVTEKASNQVAHVNCGNCRTTLMYPSGAPSVKCALCQYVTNVNVGVSIIERSNTSWICLAGRYLFIYISLSHSFMCYRWVAT